MQRREVVGGRRVLAAREQQRAPLVDDGVERALERQPLRLRLLVAPLDLVVAARDELLDQLAVARRRARAAASFVCSSWQLAYSARASVTSSGVGAVAASSV